MLYIVTVNIDLLKQKLEIIGRIMRLFSCIQETRPEEE